MVSPTVILLILAFAGTTFCQDNEVFAGEDAPNITLVSAGSENVVVSWNRTGPWEGIKDFSVSIDSLDSLDNCTSDVSCSADPCIFDSVEAEDCIITSCTILDITVEANGTASDPMSVTTAPPSASNVSANVTVKGSDKKAECSWTLSDGDSSCHTNTRIVFRTNNTEYIYNEAVGNVTKEHTLHACDVGPVSCTVQTFGGDGESSETTSNEDTFNSTDAGSLINNLTLTPGNDTINTSWTLSTNNCTRLTGYRISWNPGNPTGVVLDDEPKEYPINDLLPCTEYEVTLQPLTNETEVLATAKNETANTNIIALKPPSNVTVDNTTNTNITVSWTQEKWGPLCPILNYSVSWESTENPEDFDSQVIESAASTITNLTPCTNYMIEIKSGNNAGYSIPVPIAATTDSTVLEPPSELTADNSTDTTITVRWTPTELGLLCPLLNFSVSWKATENSGDAGFQIVNETDYEYTITNLTACTNYIIEVRAGNSVGFSDPVTSTEITDLVVLMAPSEVIEENVTTDSITLSWIQDDWGPLCPVLNYNVSWASMESPDDSGYETTENDTYTISGLSACTRYNITVRALNTVGPSEPATYENKTEVIAPGPPLDVTCLETSSPNGISVSWSEPSKTNCVKGYKVRYTGDVLWNSTEDKDELPTNDTSIDLDDLTPWTRYTVSVAGDIGDGELGDFGNCTTATPEDTPGPPLFLNKTNADARSITLEWSRPVEENGILLGYTLTWGRNNYRNFTANDTRAVIKLLDRRTSYNFTLWAITRVGLGDSISVIVSTGGANVAAIVVPIIFCLILLILVIIAYLNKEKLRDYFKNANQKRSRMMDDGNNTEMSERRRPPPPPPSGPPFIDIEGVRKENLRNYIADLEFNSQEGLEQEFTVLKERSPELSTDTAKEFYNRPKNRFINILPYNGARVILSEVQGFPGSDYINASYIWDYYEKKSFIAAQGPKENTTADFWRMVWELNVYNIVMLTNLMEKGRDKCSKYWPDPEEGPVTHGSYTIQNHNEEKEPLYTNRILEIQSGEHKRTVKHYHFTSWPDFGVPQHEDQLLDFISKIRTQTVSAKRPMVVHCSAGVGRTGTFIALWNLMENVDKDPHASEINIKKTILQMRHCRPMMVQSQDQYLYLCKCIAIYIENPGRWKEQDEADDNIYENAGYQNDENIYENDEIVAKMQTLPIDY